MHLINFALPPHWQGDGTGEFRREFLLSLRFLIKQIKAPSIVHLPRLNICYELIFSSNKVFIVIMVIFTMSWNFYYFVIIQI